MHFTSRTFKFNGSRPNQRGALFIYDAALRVEKRYEKSKPTPHQEHTFTTVYFCSFYSFYRHHTHYLTRMHSSRMRSAHSSIHLLLGGVWLSACCLDTPSLGLDTPWVWAWTHPPSVGLDPHPHQIPNLPLGCGPRHPPARPTNLPLGLGLDTPP